MASHGRPGTPDVFWLLSVACFLWLWRLVTNSFLNHLDALEQALWARFNGHT
jgi:hypothetical protein